MVDRRSDNVVLEASDDPAVGVREVSPGRVDAATDREASYMGDTLEVYVDPASGESDDDALRAYAAVTALLCSGVVILLGAACGLA